MLQVRKRQLEKPRGGPLIEDPLLRLLYTFLKGLEFTMSQVLPLAFVGPGGGLWASLSLQLLNISIKNLNSI